MSEQTKDQKAYFEEFRGELDALMGHSADDALLFSRIFKQGPDPWAIMQVYPQICVELAQHLLLEEAEIVDAITKAHFMGPAVLISKEGGIPSVDPLDDLPVDEDITGWGKELKLEAAWLFLAEFSRCVEAGYPQDTSFIERQRHLVGAVMDAQRTLIVNGGLQPHMMYSYLNNLLADFEFEPAEAGVVSKCLRGTPDRGFYAGYKAGHPVVAVDDGGLRFWGTDTSVTLEEAGVDVDKAISPFFGIKF